MAEDEERSRTLSLPHAGAAPAGEAAFSVDPDRYTDLGIIAAGSFGEVRRVRDRKLDRVVAIKILHPELAHRPDVRHRIVQEAKWGARLQHPAIVAVYDYGALPDGRVWIAMPEVRGRTLADVLRRRSTPESAAQWTERRLLEAIARACHAMAFAHENGVIHRDLSPQNLMLGERGEVFVMDWGLARGLTSSAVQGTNDAAGEGEPPGARGGDDRSPNRDTDLQQLFESASLGSTEAAVRPETDGSGEDSGVWHTAQGAVLGTPAYMAPEQARGEVHLHGPASDIYALGAILYHVLAGRPPFVGSAALVVTRVASGPPQRIAEIARVPDDLAAVVAKAMAFLPEHRFPTAADLAQALFDWLDGMTRREKASKLLGEATKGAPLIASLRAREADLRGRAEKLLSSIPPHAGAEAKKDAWALLDDADHAAQARRLAETEQLTSLHGAIAIDPALDAAHEALADHYKEAVIEAELDGRAMDATRFETLLRVHDRGRHTRFLRGTGTLSIATDPPGARATLYRYAPHQRRLVAEHVRDLGETPIAELSVDRGSYLVVLTKPGYAACKLPVWLGRGERWDGARPQHRQPEPIRLLPEGALGPDEAYVPAGWAWIGGDPDAPDTLARRRVWVDGFVMDRFPVTEEAYLAFLNELVRAGREHEALAACPRTNLGAGPDSARTLAYVRTREGLFARNEEDRVLSWTPRCPAALMSWHAAKAYAAHRAEATGLPWRLPNELEREKACRGADGRKYPWGDTFDPSWACTLESHAGEPGRAAVGAYPEDESPYGIRGLAGNTRDFCENAWRREGPKIDEGGLWIRTADSVSESDHVSVRGGAWSSVPNHCRAAARFGIRPDQGRSATGIRLVRGISG